MTFPNSKKALQFAVAIGGLVPVLAGGVGMIMGPGMVGDAPDTSISLDSHYRYLSGLLLGIGVFFWMMIPDIERKESRFRMLAGIVIIGGCGRLWSLITSGMPDKSMLFGLVMELAITPVLAYWQYRVARSHRS